MDSHPADRVIRTMRGPKTYAEKQQRKENLLTLANDKFPDICYSCYGMACGLCHKTISDLKGHIRTCHKKSITYDEVKGIEQLFSKRAAALRKHRNYLEKDIFRDYDGRKCLDCGEYYATNETFTNHVEAGCGTRSEPVPLGSSICGRLVVLLPFPEAMVNSEQIEDGTEEPLVKTRGSEAVSDDDNASMDDDEDCIADISEKLSKARKKASGYSLRVRSSKTHVDDEEDETDEEGDYGNPGSPTIQALRAEIEKLRSKACARKQELMEVQNERDQAYETIKGLKDQLKRKRSVEQDLNQELFTWKKRFFTTKKSNCELQIHLCDLQSNHM